MAIPSAISTMKEQKAPPPDLTSVRQQIERLEQELTAWKTLEQSLVAIKTGEAAMGLKGLFQNMKPIEAICAFLKRQGKPQTRFVIIHAVIAGEARLGKNKEKSINQSISTNVGLKKLKESNRLVGMTQWPDEKFMADR